MGSHDPENGRDPAADVPVKRISPGSSEEQPLFDGEGKFGKRYKVRRRSCDRPGMQGMACSVLRLRLESAHHRA